VATAQIPRRHAVIASAIRLTAVLLGAFLAVAVGGARTAWAAASAPYFTALPAAGSTELQTARYLAAAAPLPDGQVLIAGGTNGSILQSAELFDPATDTFTPSGDLQTAREGAVAAPLPDGQVLIAGGHGTSSYLRSAELFSPASDTFTALPASGATELQTAREDAVAAPLPDGDVLIAGGSPDGSSILQSAELFNPATDTFTALPASGPPSCRPPAMPRWRRRCPTGRC
jgi:hypothetical protein